MSLVILMFINITMATWFNNARIFNVLPAIYLIVLVVFCANSKLEESVIAGFTIGFLYDIFFGNIFGFDTLVYMWLGLLVNMMTKKYFSNEYIVVLIITIFSIILYDVLNFIVFFLFNGKMYFLTYMLNIVLPELAYSIILYFPVNSLIIKYKRFLRNM